jgi:hypothetical protein
MLTQRSLLTPSVFLVLACMGCLVHAEEAATVDSAQAPPNPFELQISGDELWFHTLGGKDYSVFRDAIWRIREACNPSEPPGTTIIDFAYVRLFASEPFDVVLNELRLTTSLIKLTAPNGVPVYLVADKIVEVYEPVPGLYHPETHSIVGSLEGRQQVQESKAHVSAMIDSIRGANTPEISSQR